MAAWVSGGWSHDLVKSYLGVQDFLVIHIFNLERTVSDSFNLNGIFKKAEHLILPGNIFCRLIKETC